MNEYPVIPMAVKDAIEGLMSGSPPPNHFHMAAQMLDDALSRDRPRTPTLKRQPEMVAYLRKFLVPVAPLKSTR